MQKADTGLQQPPFSLQQDPGLKSRFSSDLALNQLYPESSQLLAEKHWTPLNIARKAARYLANEEGARILDIGSGVGKFCLAAAYHQPNAQFFGIEQRHHLYHTAETARLNLALPNVEFIYGNFTQLDLTAYDHFYFYNSFHENLVDHDHIDESIDYSVELYFYYTRFLFKQLEKMPSGTRIVTYHSLEGEIPPGFNLAGSVMDSQLKFWIKQ